MAKDASDSAWAWQNRKNKPDLHIARLFGMQKYTPCSCACLHANPV